MERSGGLLALIPGRMIVLRFLSRTVVKFYLNLQTNGGKFDKYQFIVSAKWVVQ